MGMLILHQNYSGEAGYKRRVLDSLWSFMAHPRHKAFENPLPLSISFSLFSSFSLSFSLSLFLFSPQPQAEPSPLQTDSLSVCFGLLLVFCLLLLLLLLATRVGKIGRFSLQVLMMNVCSGLGMLALATVIVDTIGTPLFLYTYIHTHTHIYIYIYICI